MSQRMSKLEVTTKPNHPFKHVNKQHLINLLKHHSTEPIQIAPNTKNQTLYRMWWDLCNRKFGYNIIPQSELDRDANLTG